jgi:hypothetical protein
VGPGKATQGIIASMEKKLEIRSARKEKNAFGSEVKNAFHESRRRIAGKNAGHIGKPI